jgi:hypothetical protein
MRITTINDLRTWVAEHMGRGWGDPDYNRLRDAITQRLWDDPSRPSRPGADWSEFFGRTAIVEIAKKEYERLRAVAYVNAQYERLRK